MLLNIIQKLFKAILAFIWFCAQTIATFILMNILIAVAVELFKFLVKLYNRYNPFGHEFHV